MAGRADPSRDLRLGLYALESGEIDREQLASAVRAWARSADRPIAEILRGRGLLDAGAIARLEARVARELEGPAGAVEAVPAGEADPSATMTHDGRGRAEAPGRGPAEAAGGREIGRRFLPVRPHASGGLGRVFLAHDRELNRQVALKEIRPRLAHDPDARARFLVEAEITGRLEHPGVVPVYSLGRYEDGRPYYATRFIEGETLRDAIERFHRKGGAGPAGKGREVAFNRLLRSLIDACNVVAYAHSRGVVHRDLKPENIMLGPFGETLVVDWGLAKSSEAPGTEPGSASPTAGSGPDASITMPGSVLGTPRYMSPEQAAGDPAKVGPASDIYSLGAILYCMLVGRPPALGGDLAGVLDRVRRGIFPAPRRLRRSVDPALEMMCLKAMALDPGDRHASALELADALQSWQAEIRYRGEQVQAIGRVKDSQARFCLERAHRGFGREARDEGMLWLARALEHAPAEPPDLQRLIRTSLHGWHASARLLERAFRHGGEVHAVAFCPEGRRIATACEDGTARLWDVSTGTPLSAPIRHAGPVRAVAFHPGGASVATAGDDGSIRLWDALTGEAAGPPFDSGAPVACLIFNEDGSKVAAIGVSGGFALLDVATSRPLHPPAGLGAPARAAAFSHDGGTVAVACGDGSVRILGADDGGPIGDPHAYGSAVSALAFDPAGRLLSGCVDGRARVRDVAGGAAEVSVAHPGEVHRAGFRPGGEAFATSCRDGAARLWETATGRPIGEPLAHPGRVDCLAFRPDGTMLATGGVDGTVRLWCAATGLPIGPSLAHTGPVRSLAFSPDGRRLAAAGPDPTVLCWTPPLPIEGDPGRIACWVGVSTGLEFDEGDAVRRVDGPTLWDLRRHLNDLGGPPIR